MEEILTGAIMPNQTTLPQNFEGKTVLVAGAAGFIPSHLCETYLRAGARVIGMDNFLTGQESNIKLLEQFENFSFEECNIYHPLPSMKGLQIDYIFSLASPASPRDFNKVPIDIMRVNSEGTRNLLELARDKGARFLEASTSEVYGDPKVHPQDESYVGHVNPIGGRACYDESKRYAEALTMAYHSHYRVDTRIVRIFNTYGPRMRADDGRVIPNFINQALKGENLTIYGDGKQTRSFCFVTDLIKAIQCVMFCDIHTPFNCGNDTEITIQECAELIVGILSSPSKLDYAPLPEGDPANRKPCLKKLQSIGDYRPTTSFQEGIKATAEYFRG